MVPWKRRRHGDGAGQEAGCKKPRDDEVTRAETLWAPSPRFLDEVLVAPRSGAGEAGASAPWRLRRAYAAHEPFNGST